MINQPPNQTPVQSQFASPPTQASQKPKSQKPYIAGMIVCILLAIAGIAFGIYGIFQIQSKDAEISTLNSQISNQNQEISSLKSENSSSSSPDKSSTQPIQGNETNSYCKNISDPSQNPVLTDTAYPLSCSVHFIEEIVSSTSPKPTLYLSINEGEITSCQILHRSDYNDNGTFSRCDFPAISGKISKAFSFTPGQNYYPQIGLLMQDGTVQVVKYSYDDPDNITFTYDSTLPIDGFVTDIISGTIGNKEGISSPFNDDTLFILSDGIIVPYHRIPYPDVELPQS